MTTRHSTVRAGIVALLVLACLAAGAMTAPMSLAASTGTLAWGDGEQGQLGNGTTTTSDVPVAVSGLGSGVAAISAGSTHSLALLHNGTARAWGDNEDGELGDGTHTGPETCASSVACSTKPLAVSGLSGATAVSAGGGFSLALLADGTVSSWGSNFAGALGTGSTGGPERCPLGSLDTVGCAATPGAVSGLSEVVAISADGAHSLALLRDGRVMAWGDNEFGQLGDGSNSGPESCPSVGFSTVACSTKPLEVSGLSGVKAISAGDDHNLALLSNGTVVAWGTNNDGQLGNGTTTSSYIPVAVSGLSGVRAISAGGFHSLALLSDGTVMAWGDNGNGQLGTGTVRNSSVPVAVTGLSEVSAISAGLAHSLALLASGAAKAWGWNESDQLGDGTPKGQSITPVPVSELAGAIAISAGGSHSLAYSPPAPTVVAVSPHEGPQGGGTSVTVAGTEFSDASAVKFGSTAATRFTVNSSESITAFAPPGTGTVDVSVTTPAGTSASSPADRFSYVHLLGEDLPELGRCVRTHAHAEYRGRRCQVHAAGAGRFNWLPGPGTNRKFTGTAQAVELETTGAAKNRITCSSARASGEFTGPKSETETLTLLGCSYQATKQPCQSSATAPGEITTFALEGRLGFIKRAARPVAGWQLSGSPTVASFQCGTPPEATILVTIEGSVLAPVTPVAKMQTVSSLRYTVTNGKQFPESFEGGPKATLTSTFLAGIERTSEQSGLRMRESIQAEEPLEFRVACAGPGC